MPAFRARVGRRAVQVVATVQAQAGLEAVPHTTATREQPDQPNDTGERQYATDGNGGADFQLGSLSAKVCGVGLLGATYQEFAFVNHADPKPRPVRRCVLPVPTQRRTHRWTRSMKIVVPIDICNAPCNIEGLNVCVDLFPRRPANRVVNSYPELAPITHRPRHQAREAEDEAQDTDKIHEPPEHAPHGVDCTVDGVAEAQGLQSLGFFGLQSLGFFGLQSLGFGVA